MLKAIIFLALLPTYLVAATKSKAADVIAVIHRTGDVISEIHNMPGNKQIPTLCVALAVYWEVRSEPVYQQGMMASLIYTRAEKTNKSTCSVVQRPSQFPWVRNSVNRLVPDKLEKNAWEQAQTIAISKRVNHTNVEYNHTTNSFRKLPGMTIVSKTPHVVFFNWEPKCQTHKTLVQKISLHRIAHKLHKKLVRHRRR